MGLRETLDTEKAPFVNSLNKEEFGGHINKVIKEINKMNKLQEIKEKAKETYQFTKEDLINFKQQAPKILEQLNGASDEDLFDIWQEQRTIKITVE